MIFFLDPKGLIGRKYSSDIGVYFKWETDPNTNKTVAKYSTRIISNPQMQMF